MKIIITGGLGFVGSHLAEKLLKKNCVVILTKSLSKINNVRGFKNNLIIEKVNLNNFSKMEKVLKKHKADIIIHLAGITSHSQSFDSPLLDIDSNSKSTLFLLEYIRHYNPKCNLILGSTFIVVGRPKKLPVNENTPCIPTTIYGTNRLSSEYFCKIYHQVYGLNTKIFRITNAYGPREQHINKKNAVNHLIYKAFKGEEITIFEKGKFFRDFIYISDVILAIQKIITKGKPGNLYWISSNTKTWFYNFGKILENLTKTKLKFVKTPTYTKKVDVGNFVVDNSKLRSLGWKPKVNLEQGIKETLEYFQSQKIS